MAAATEAQLLLAPLTAEPEEGEGGLAVGAGEGRAPRSSVRGADAFPYSTLPTGDVRHPQDVPSCSHWGPRVPGAEQGVVWARSVLIPCDSISARGLGREAALAPAAVREPRMPGVRSLPSSHLRSGARGVGRWLRCGRQDRRTPG